MGTGQNCTKTKLHKVTKLHEGTKLHEDKFARGDKTVRRHFCTDDHISTKVKKNKRQVNTKKKEKKNVTD